MNRTAALLLPLFGSVGLAIGGASTVACQGGGPIDGVDASFDGEATQQTAANGEACEKAVITIDDGAAETAIAGGPACAIDAECTVRLAGDYCACPNTPRAMSKSRAQAFDESLNGVTAKCTCSISPCGAPPPATAACREGRCVIVE